MKTLKRHGKSHLFEFVRYVAAASLRVLEGKRGVRGVMATLPNTANTAKWITPG